MKPFGMISYPPVPSFDQFMALVSLRSTEATASEVSGVFTVDKKQQALGIIEVAESALKEARKKWEQVSKADATTAKCVNCEVWWRESVKNVLKSCIAANVAVATSKRVLADAETSSKLGERLKVEMVEIGKSYHAWWIVPKITAI